MFKSKKKYIAVFLMKQHGSYSIEKKSIIKSNVKTVKYKKDVIPIDTVNYSFTEGLKLYYYISITEKKQLFFENSKNLQIGSKVIDMILNDEIISQITSNLNQTNIGLKIMNIVMYIIFGGAIGFIIGGFIPIG